MKEVFPVPDLENLTDIVGTTRTVFTITEKESYLAYSICCPFNKELSLLCHLSNNLKNTANYYMRDCYFSKTKQNYKPKMNYGDIKYLNYGKLWKIVKNSQDYMNFRGQLAQQTLKILYNDWNSYRKNLKAWIEENNKDPTNCREKPKIPKYNRRFNKETVAIFTNQQCRIENGWLEFPKKGRYKEDPSWLPSVKLGNKISRNLGSFHQVRIVPLGSCYNIEIVYSVQKQDLRLDKSRAIALDLGSTNLLSTANNCGLRPYIVKGGVVKAINQEYNKLIKRYQAIELIKEQFFQKHKRRPKWNEIKPLLPEYKAEHKLRRELRIKFYKEHGRNPSFDELNEWYNKYTKRFLTVNYKKDQKWTMQMYRILAKRNNRIRDIFHNVSKVIIRYCIVNKIGTIFFGHNKGWKQNINIGRINNQNSSLIPFNRLIHNIRYKAELKGINVIEVNEDHTSKCSALDYESIEHHDNYLGRRKSRGLFVSSKGYRINADINGALNILRRGLETMGIKLSLDVKTMLWSPRSLLLKRPRVKAKVNPIA